MAGFTVEPQELLAAGDDADEVAALARQCDPRPALTPLAAALPGGQVGEIAGQVGSDLAMACGLWAVEMTELGEHFRAAGQEYLSRDQRATDDLNAQGPR